MDYSYELKEESGFSGTIELKMPTVKEQFKILKDLNLSPDKDGKMAFADQIDTVEKQLDLCAKYIKEVYIKHTLSGREFKSVDDMMYFKQTREIMLNDIASMLINGIDLGK